MWEIVEDISVQFQDKIDQYFDCVLRLWQLDRKEINIDIWFWMMKLEKQLDYIVGGELCQFQFCGFNFFCFNWVCGNNVIFVDEMGLGKIV